MHLYFLRLSDAHRYAFFFFFFVSSCSYEASQTMHYSVEAVRRRRVCADTGTVQYLLKWEGYDDSVCSWEPRRNLVCCSDDVNAADRKEDDEVAVSLLAHQQRKRKRFEQTHQSRGITQAEPSILLAPSASSGVPDASFAYLYLGEKVTAPVETTLKDTIRNHQRHTSKHRTDRRRCEAPRSQLARKTPVTVLQAHERAWNQNHTEGLFRLSCSSEILANFPQAHHDAANALTDDGVNILALWPAWSLRVGRGYSGFQSKGDSTLLVQEDVKHLELGDDELVVQHATSQGTVLWTPMSSFREAFPQALIDFLLSQSVILAT